MHKVRKDDLLSTTLRVVAIKLDLNVPTRSVGTRIKNLCDLCACFENFVVRFLSPLRHCKREQNLLHLVIGRKNKKINFL